MVQKNKEKLLIVSHKNLSTKKKFLFYGKKKFVQQTNIDLYMAKLSFFFNMVKTKEKKKSVVEKYNFKRIDFLRYLRFKTLFYRLAKELNLFKASVENRHITDNPFLKLQSSKIYASKDETKKKKLLRSLQKNQEKFLLASEEKLGLKQQKWLLELYASGAKKNISLKTEKSVFILIKDRKTLRKIVFFRPWFFRNSLKNLKKKIKYFSSKKKSKLRSFFSLEKKRMSKTYFLSKSYLRVFSKYMARKKKVFRVLKKRIRARRWKKIRIRKLVNVIYKRRSWLGNHQFSPKIVRKKRWKSEIHPVFKYYRQRHRLFFRYYIPRYLEINYKTFSFIHLDSTNFSTVGNKIPFHLNLGRVLTFLTL